MRGFVYESTIPQDDDVWSFSRGKGRGQNRELQINARLALRKFQSYSPTIDEMFTRGVGCACGPIVEFPRF
ncbi:hypothetical protein TGRH88_054550 [Toxoplasma gondii]|uniref:Uncharacterized protein n=1 Tax=Toxoplasma gondii TaxID=5811 RepID=A0A7J6JWV7_TOXGO|nr:hypothetical protein TGRH88_054550 [Toxoplasma gondii]